MRFLIGVDGSAKSLDAVRLVGRLADPASDAVAVCFSPLELERQLPGQSRELVDGAVDGLFAEVCGLLPTGLACAPERIRVEQPAALALLESAATWKADVLVVGARGHGAIEGFILGSVSRAVVHGATLPVLVARGVPPAARPPRVLVGHHPASAAAVTTAMRGFRWPAGTEGRVIGVTESLLAGPLPAWVEQRVRDPDTAAIANAWKKEHEAEVATLGGTLASFAAGLPEPFRKHAPIVAEGNPGERILERAAADGVDLIVVGRTPTDALSRWLLGSTSEAVLTRAAASVLIVPVERAAT
jgi:nucleotide-binding universal stress UspA family protein